MSPTKQVRLGIAALALCWASLRQNPSSCQRDAGFHWQLDPQPDISVSIRRQPISVQARTQLVAEAAGSAQKANEAAAENIRDNTRRTAMPPDNTCYSRERLRHTNPACSR